MSNIAGLQAEYLKLRENGLDPKTALSHLRADIIALEATQREQLLGQLRAWEIDNAAKAKAKRNPSDTTPIPPIKPLQTAQVPQVSDTNEINAAPDTPQEQVAVPAKINCPNCGKPNDRSEIFCYSCGHLLSMEHSTFSTRHFTDEEEPIDNDEIFTSDATLVMIFKGTQENLRIRPQEKRHELVIGRGGGGTMKPDVDLAPYHADELGVSRMHASVSYNEKHSAVSIMDMDSANGTYINGQRLHPEEKRVLRHGDELRLGKLIVFVFFYRPKRATP